MANLADLALIDELHETIIELRAKLKALEHEHDKLRDKVYRLEVEVQEARRELPVCLHTGTT